MMPDQVVRKVRDSPVLEEKSFRYRLEMAAEREVDLVDEDRIDAVPGQFLIRVQLAGGQFQLLRDQRGQCAPNRSRNVRRADRRDMNDGLRRIGDELRLQQVEVAVQDQTLVRSEPDR